MQKGGAQVEKPSGNECVGRLTGHRTSGTESKGVVPPGIVLGDTVQEIIDFGCPGSDDFLYVGRQGAIGVYRVLVNTEEGLTIETFRCLTKFGHQSSEDP